MWQQKYPNQILSPSLDVSSQATEEEDSTKLNVMIRN